MIFINMVYNILYYINDTWDPKPFCPLFTNKKYILNYSTNLPMVTGKT